MAGAKKSSVGPDESSVNAKSRRPALNGRPSNGFSRKKANLRAALALYFAYYNFCRMHRSIRMTPAMATGIARGPWKMADLLAAVS